MKWLFIIFFFPFIANTQISDVLVIGNSDKVCVPDSLNTIFSDTLPSDINAFASILIFSNAGNGLSAEQVEQLVEFVEHGGGLYLGAESAPLQTESNQLTNRFYRKSSYGNFQVPEAQSSNVGKLKLNELDSIPAGQTIAAFPMDYRLTVEAWVHDQPLILSGTIEKGRIIIDGGYSRFYCENKNTVTDEILKRIIAFLIP